MAQTGRAWKEKLTFQGNMVGSSKMNPTPGSWQQPDDKTEKPGLKLNIQEMKLMASGFITSWQIDGEIVTEFIFLGSKITADGDCSHEMKTLASWKKSYDKPKQYIKKQRH